MALSKTSSINSFHSYPGNTLGDHLRRNSNPLQYPKKQRNLEWHEYLRRQANLPPEVGLPYGKRSRSDVQFRKQSFILHDDGEAGLPYGKRSSSNVQSRQQSVILHDDGEVGLPFGKRSSSNVQSRQQSVIVTDDEEVGISKIDFNSPPVTLTWLDLRAEAPPKDEGIKRSLTKVFFPSKELSKPKQLLKGVSGIAKPGQLVAIMGASGAGKTTLMNILTHRRPGALKITGEIRVNGTRMGQNINRVAGYVQQEELFIPSMTTREHLFFHAMLRLDRDVPKEERLKRVDEILDFLNLKKAENTMIGQPGRIKGLSGGEKRRLMFASEVLVDPPLLFADEPTSGLDGSMAFIVCDAMRKLCNKGKTIVCTIHQPSSEIFELFDTLYLLAEGRVAYLGSRIKATTYFSQLGYNVPTNYNPSDYFIQTLAILPFDKEASLERVEAICDEYEQSSMYAQSRAEAQEFHDIDNDVSNPSGGLFNRSPRFKAGFLTQLRWLLWRSILNMRRNPFEARLLFILSVVIGVCFGLLFLRLHYNQQAFQNMSAVIFMLIINTSFSNVQAVADSYTREYPVFFKEHDDGIYRTVPYYLSKFVIELPIYALSTFILGTIVYWLSNLYNNVRRYFILQGILILVGMVSLALGSVVAIIAPTPEVAAALVVPIIIPLLVFGGFFISAKTIPNWLIWIKYLSWFYYANEMALINQWEDVTSLECNPTAGNSTCFKTGNDIINYYGFSKSHYNRNLGLLFLLFGSFRLISISGLILRARFQQR